MEKYLKSKLEVRHFILFHIIFLILYSTGLSIGLELPFGDIFADFMFSLVILTIIFYMVVNLLFIYKMRYNKISEIFAMAAFIIIIHGTIILVLN